MLHLLDTLIQALQPTLVPICFTTAWALVVLVIWNIWRFGGDGIATIKRLHQIPCANCQFFTDDYRLKCTVHPTFALTEEAINCSDFCPQNRKTIF